MYLNKSPYKISSWHVFKNLLAADLKIFKHHFVNKLIDLGIYITVITTITVYILPFFGLPQDYGIIMVSGIIAGVGIMELYPNSIGLASDLTGNKTITYMLILPIPSWLIPIKNICYFALTSVMIGIFSIPIAKALLGNLFDLSAVNWLLFGAFFILSAIFFGTFTIILATTMKDLATSDRVWLRFIFPLWFLGGYQFTWYSLYSLYPWLAYIDLLNPFIYVTEGIRATMLGQEGYIPLWICTIMLIFFIIIFGFIGVYRLKKQLDFV